jgi:hypothetical protein
VKISDEMAEAACKSFFSDLGKEPTGGEDELRGFMRAAIEAAVGDLVLVPREPTEAMLKAGYEAYEDAISGHGLDGPASESADACYRAMISAHTQDVPSDGRGESVSVEVQCPSCLDVIPLVVQVGGDPPAGIDFTKYAAHTQAGPVG